VSVRRISIVVAEDHGVVRECLVARLAHEPDLEVVAEAEDGEQAFARIEERKPDVAIVDIEEGRLTGVEIARRVRDDGLRTAVVLLSTDEEPALARAALEAGASAYVLHRGGTRELLEAVRAAAAGDLHPGPCVASTALGARDPEPAPDTRPLSPRERDVLRLLARGLSSQEIAAALGISFKTVVGHRSEIMDKLGIRHVPGLVKYAIRNQLATLED